MMLDITYHSYKEFFYFKALTERLFTYINPKVTSLHRGIMSFYSSTEIHAGLDSGVTLSDVTNTLSSISTQYGGTDVIRAFRAILDDYFAVSSKERTGFSKVSVMVIDSRHRYWISQGLIRDIQSDLRESCVNVVVVAMRGRVDQGLLEALVSRDNILYQSVYSDLTKPSFLQSVINKVKTAVVASLECQQAQPTTTSSQVDSTTVNGTKNIVSTNVTLDSPTNPIETTEATQQLTTQENIVSTEASNETTTKSSTSSTSTTPLTFTSGSQSIGTFSTSLKTSLITSTTELSTTFISTTAVTTTLEQTSVATVSTTESPSSGCELEKSECDSLCGGCGYMDVTRYCYVDGVKEM